MAQTSASLDHSLPPHSTHSKYRDIRFVLLSGPPSFQKTPTNYPLSALTIHIPAPALPAQSRNLASTSAITHSFPDQRPPPNAARKVLDGSQSIGVSRLTRHRSRMPSSSRRFGSQ
ncbi:hypothetical protein KM043_008315 [Ampulex compressa]|nr:hypothetical protein KM043_008315 [Ampulex compressa]